jgi:hypothetical protein
MITATHSSAAHRFGRRWSPLATIVKKAAPKFYWIAWLIVASAIGLELAAPDKVATIDPASISKDQGFAYTLRLRSDSAMALWVLAPGDDLEAQHRSLLELFEDGRPLREAHARHENIRALGGGRYSHWHRILLFSSTDGTSPPTAAHTYSYRAPQSIAPWLRGLALLCAFFILFRLRRSLLAALVSPELHRLVVLLSMAAALTVTALTAYSLWGAWQLIDLQADSAAYLAPAATALFSGDWGHLMRPFVYPAIAFVAIWSGGTLDHLIALHIAAYLLGAPLIYAIVLMPGQFVARPLDHSRPAFHRSISHLIAATAVVVYFSLSALYLASVFYVAPEIFSSIAALTALWLVLKLMLDRELKPGSLVACALGTGLCAAAIVGMKPALLALAGLSLLLAGWGLWQQRTRLQPVMLIVTCGAMIALPAAVAVGDRYLAHQYHDVSARLFGPTTVFCNNADIISQALETPSSRARQLLGDTAARDVAQFLKDVQEDESWPILGFNGDRCMYTFAARRIALERRYFGPTSDDVVRTYRQLLTASIADAPEMYTIRVARQFKRFLLDRSADDCYRHDQHTWLPGTFAPDLPMVQRLVEERGSGIRRRMLPHPLPLDTLCNDFAKRMTTAHIPLVALALSGATLCFFGRRTMPRRLMTLAQAALVSIGFWLSTAPIVALVHTFDIERYITVTFPLYVVMLASTLCFSLVLAGYGLTRAVDWGRGRRLGWRRLPKSPSALPPAP